MLDLPPFYKFDKIQRKTVSQNVTVCEINDKDGSIKLTLYYLHSPARLCINVCKMNAGPMNATLTTMLLRSAREKFVRNDVENQ
jgi:hypothetical protein